MSDGPVQELQEYRVRLANGELEIVRGTSIEHQTVFNGPDKILAYAGRELVGEFFAPLGWFKAPRNKLLGFEDGFNDALSSSWLSRSGPHTLESYRAGWDAGAELHTFRAEKERLAERAALTPAPVEAEPGIPDALGEFMKREGAVKHDQSRKCPVDPVAIVETVAHGDFLSYGKPMRAGDVHWEFQGAYRVVSIPDSGTWYQEAVEKAAAKASDALISEPAAGEGEDAETRAMTNPHSTLAAAPAGFTEFTLETVLSYDWKDRFEIIRRDGRREVLLGDDCTWGFNEQPEPDDILFFRNIGPSAAAPDTTPDAELNSGPFENDGPDRFTISASKPHADESNAQMFAAGINRELEKA